MNKKWMIWLTCVMVAVLMVAGLGVIAAEYGSQSDPLITLSYIEEVLLPQTKDDVDEQIQEALEDYEDLLSTQSKDVEKYIDKKLRSFAAGDIDDALIAEIATAIVQQMDASVPANAPWAVVDVPAGYTVACEAGVQVILRAGQVSCDAALVDLSDGETLSGGNLTANHLYTTDAQGRTLISQGCTLLIAGSYTVR